MLLENTVRCNIDCIGCDRQSAARIRTTLQMDLEKLSRMADLVHDLGLEQLFYLNLGEPFLSPNIGQELPCCARRTPNCRIVISTNGIVLNTDAKREAALDASHIFFSIAGVNDAMLKKYEHFGSFQKAYDNMKALVEYRERARPLPAVARMEIPPVQLERPPATPSPGPSRWPRTRAWTRFRSGPPIIRSMGSPTAMPWAGSTTSGSRVGRAARWISGGQPQSRCKRALLRHFCWFCPCLAVFAGMGE